MLSRSVASLGLLLLVSTSACAGGACVGGPAAEGVRLTVRDARTAAVLDTAAVVTVTRLSPLLAPQRPDSMSGSLSVSREYGPLGITDTTAGRYKILVAVPGYQAWSRTVDVERGACGLAQTVTLEATLVALS